MEFYAKKVMVLLPNYDIFRHIQRRSRNSRSVLHIHPCILVPHFQSCKFHPCILTVPHLPFPLFHSTRLSTPTLINRQHCAQRKAPVIMAALWQAITFLPCGFVFLLSFFFFPRLFSAVADWVSTILTHMVRP